MRAYHTTLGLVPSLYDDLDRGRRSPIEAAVTDRGGFEGGNLYPPHEPSAQF